MISRWILRNRAYYAHSQGFINESQLGRFVEASKDKSLSKDDIARLQKRPVQRISILFFFVVFISCGVNKDEYDKVVDEYDKVVLENSHLKKEIVALKERLDLSEIKANISKLKVLFQKYKTGEIEPGHLVIQIKKIDPENNLNKFSDIYGDMSGQIIQALSDIVKLNQSYQIERKKYIEKLESIENDIQTTKKKIERLGNEGYQYISARIERRFDTDTYTGKGYYEAIDMGSFRKIVIIATEKEAKTRYRGAEKQFLVKSLGEKATTVTRTTALQSYEVTEYYEYFITVDESDNPRKLKKELSELEDVYLKKKKSLEKQKKTLLDKTEKDINKKINRILEKI